MDHDLRVQGALTVDGNVAIGMTSPTNRLHVRTPGTDAARFEVFGGSDIYLWFRESYGPIIDYGRTGSVFLRFRSSTNGTTFTERLLIQNGGTIAMAVNGGNVGVGTASPVAKLDVAGSVAVSGNVGIAMTTPAEPLEVTGNVGIRVYPPNDSTPGLVSYALRSRESGGSMRTWRLYTAAVGGGYGVPANGLAIWEYPGNGQPGCCFARFGIEPTPGGGPSPGYLTLDGAGRLKIDQRLIADKDGAYYAP